MSDIQNHTIEQGERLSFFKLFSEKGYKVSIPIIQRDYAQGRSTTKEVRVNFLTALHDYLTEEKPFRDLDFVYGTVSDIEDENVFIPLDGQQRLTTLFLLHWYLCQISTDETAKQTYLSTLLKNGKSRFTYQTRTSSTEFCDALMSHGYDMSALLPPDKEQNNALSKTIRNSSWFYLSWRHDPTIQSMLTMLDAIHEMFHEDKHFLPLLIDTKKPVITFLFLDLGIFNLTDDLYIKMNSRGKPLTAFENFKAKYEQSLEAIDLGKESFKLVFDGKEQPVSLSRYFSYNIDVKWANLLWNYRDIQNRENSTIDNTFDDEIMNFIRVVFTNRFAAINEFGSSEDNQNRFILDYLRGADVVKRRSDYSDVLSYHKYKEFGIAFDRDDEERIKNYPENGLFKIQTSKETAYGYALALVHALDCLENGNNPIKHHISEEYKQYFNEEAILRQVFAHNLDSHHDRVCFHAYLRFLIENKGDLTGIDEWMRVIHNLSHPESTIMNEGTHMASAIKSVEAMLPYSKDILGYLKGDPSIGAFSAWQSLEEKVKAHLITRSQAWKVLIERTEKHGYFNGQIGFLLSFSGILDYYLQDKRYCCDWSEEEDKRYYASFKDYAEKACLVFMYDYDHRENDNDYVFERAVFTKGNYIGVSTAWRRNLFSTSVGKNNVRRDHSWKRFLRMTEDPEWRQYQNFVKAVFDDPRFDKSNVHDSLLTICQDLTMTWRDLFIQEPEMFAYCEQGFLHYVNDNRIILLSQSQYNHYHAELYTYFLWKNVLEERISMYPLFKEIWYYQVKNSEDEPGICFSDYIHNRINYELSIYYEETEDETGGQYELCFYKKHRSNAHLEDYPDDMAAILEDAGFYWDEENEYFHCLFTSSTDLLERIDSFYKNLSFELSA